MKSLSLTFAVKDIADRAGDITAVLGASRANEEGNVLFERLALTGDDYLVVCHAVVEAATEIENRCMGYMPEVRLLRETDSDLLREVSFVFVVPDDGVDTVVMPLNECLMSFLVYYLVGYWLRMKLPEECEGYLLQAEGYLSKVFSLLHRRERGVKRGYRLY